MAGFIGFPGSTPGDAEDNPYFDSFRRAFLDSVALLANRLQSDYAVAEPFSSATGLILTNAVVENGYVRNTVQQGAEQLPKMTSNTAPAGNTASASSAYNTTYAAWKMWNKSASTSDTGDVWLSGDGAALPQWNRLKTADSFTFRRYRLYGRGTGNNGNPVAWQLQISDDNGASWTAVDSQSGQNIPNGGYSEHELAENVTADDLRVYVTERTTGTAATYVSIGALRLYAAGEVDEARIILPLVEPEGDPVEGYVLLKIMDADNPESAISVGTSGTDLVSASLSTDGGATFTPLSFGTPEDAQEGYFRFTSPAISLVGQTGLQLKIQTHDRGAGAPNVRVDDAIIMLRSE